MSDVALCEVCSTFLRPGCRDNLCSSCYQVAHPPRACGCGHSAVEHHHGRCNGGFFDYVSGQKSRCACEGFAEVAA